MMSSKNEEVVAKGRIASRQRSQEGRHKIERRRSYPRPVFSGTEC